MIESVCCVICKSIFEKEDKSPTDECLLCTFYLSLLQLSVGCFNVVILRCCGREITYSVAVGVQQRSFYYIFCACTFFFFLNYWKHWTALRSDYYFQAKILEKLFCQLVFMIFFSFMLWIQWWWCWSLSLLLWSGLNNSTTIMWRGSSLLMWWSPELFS